jgi:hypothetical protein
MVHTILRERSQGEPPGSVVQAHSIALTTVNTWISAKRWRSDNLPARLAKLADYEAYRERLDMLAKQLGLMTEDLPPPAKPKMMMDAAKLKASLELLIEKQAIRGIGHGKGPNLLESVGKEAGCSIWHWLKADGALRKPPGAVARLAGYAELREELQELFARMGHLQTAQSLPESGADSVGKMTTALLVDALTAIAKDGTVSLRRIGADLRLDAVLLATYVARDDASLRNIGIVQKLPDYGQNREALSAALKALGHGEQADGLPHAHIDAATFLSTLRSSLDRFAVAMDAMRCDPTLSAHDAASRANVPSAAFCAVIGADGAMRERSEVHSLLTGLKPYLAPGIDDQIDRLRAVAFGEAPASAPAVRMAAVQFPKHGSIPAKVFIVRSTTKDPGPGTQNRLKNLYADNPDLVREPRSYETDRPRQVLRWLATILREAFPDSREVQCYYDAKNKEVIVSSNLTTINRGLAALLPRGGLIECIERLCDQGVAQGSREARHLEKLLVTLQADPARVWPRLLGEVLAAMSKARFRVPEQNFNEYGKHVHLHAERRIKHELQRTSGEQVDRRFLAGTMRPCGTCAEDLGFDDSERRGPFWLSQPAQALVDTPRIMERNVGNSIGTYVTKTRAGKVTANYDTDSDSDIEQTERRIQRSSSGSADAATAAQGLNIAPGPPRPSAQASVKRKPPTR